MMKAICRSKLAANVLSLFICLMASNVFASTIHCNVFNKQDVSENIYGITVDFSQSEFGTAPVAQSSTSGKYSFSVNAYKVDPKYSDDVVIEVELKREGGVLVNMAAYDLLRTIIPNVDGSEISIICDKSYQ